MSYFTEEDVDAVVESILEAAEEGLELSEEELVELSRKTLGSYIGKAAVKLRTSSERSAEPYRSDENHKKNDKLASKRETGILRAAKRLTKNESYLSAIVEAAFEKNPVALKEYFELELSSRIVDAIDEIRESFFQTKPQFTEEDDEETIQHIMSSLIEAATKEDIELSEDELVEMTTAVLDEAWKTKVAVKGGKVDKSGLDANSKYRIRYRDPRGGKSDTPKANATHAVAYRTGSKNESAELAELSKSTLGSYINKASKDATRKRGRAEVHAQRDPDAAEPTFVKSDKRLKGVSKAVDRLTK